MLVYANHLTIHGDDAELAVFKAIGGWLKEQLGFGLHPDQLKRDGEFDGHKGEARSWLRIYATDENQPKLYAWVLKNTDETVRGRQWVTELGARISKDTIELSCIVKTEETSTLVAAPVMASRPRVIGYIVSNVQHSSHAEFSNFVPGVDSKVVGRDKSSYQELRSEILRPDRDYPLVLVSPTWSGEYLITVPELQQRLVGLAQVYEIDREFNSYEMAEVVGENRSAWRGAINILYAPTQTGIVRNKLFRALEIEDWGTTQHERISHILAWVTNTTNVLRSRKRVRPEGVTQLALRRRLTLARETVYQMDLAQLREEMEKTVGLAAKEAEWINTLWKENSALESEVVDLKTRLDSERESQKKQNFKIEALKAQLENAGAGRSNTVDIDGLLRLVSSADPPTPLECIEAIEEIYGDKCVVLESAKESAEDMDRFVHGRRLLDMLKKLATEYRTKLIEGGDNEARKIFGNNEYAAKESETVMANKTLR